MCPSDRKPWHCNLDRFLESTCPFVSPQLFPKSCHWKTCRRKQLLNDDKLLPYFMLSDLWSCFDEWSAYGAGVPITLGHHDTVIQYYVPYLSALQLYTRSQRKPYLMLQRSEDESDTGESDSRDSGCEGSSDGDSDRLPESWNCNCGQDIMKNVSTCCVCEKFKNEGNIVASESEDGQLQHWNGHLLFEYFEETSPHVREPLAEKISKLSQACPQLMCLRSIDLLPASWMAVAWYPIYRIPTGPTLQDLDACFLSFHCLSTSMQDGISTGIVEPIKGPLQCSVNVSPENESGPRIYLHAFGLAHYKLRGSIWTTTGNPERRHAASLYKCAESWLKQLRIRHPDFEFFKSHNPSPH